jgi:hypothetical protein
MKALGLAIAATLLGACGHRAAAPVSKVRFANAEPVRIVDDRRDVPAAPETRPDVNKLSGFDIAVTRRLDRALAARPDERALGTNSLGEVPDSTWFENRRVSAAAIARGPGDGTGPDLSAPLRVVKGTHTGQQPGFIAEDASGVRWMIKPETTEHAAESAADVTSQRLLWAIGYHVPENHAGYITRDQVVLADDATIKEASGEKRAMTVDDLDATFARGVERADGTYRILASRLLPGEPIGGAPMEGVRADDPNDTIPHERRRELRGLQVFAAWLQHTDFKEMGTFDVWREDPLDPDRHIVFHYLVDFGNTLGMYATHRPDDGHTEKALDVDHLKSFFSFGLWKRPWEGTPDPGIDGVGPFDVEHFDPEGFTPFAPYVPFLEMDETDAFWAVEILLGITEPQIRAALEAAKWEDPRAVDFLTEVLLGRARKSARHWLAEVSPLTDFTIRGDDLCFVDLVEAHDLEDGDPTYRAESFDWNGASLGAATVAGACVRDVALGTAHDAYTIVRIETTRGGETTPAVEIHLARDEGGGLRVIGVERRLDD